MGKMTPSDTKHEQAGLIASRISTPLPVQYRTMFYAHGYVYRTICHCDTQIDCHIYITK